MAQNYTISELGPLADGIAETPAGKVYVDRALPGDVVEALMRRDSQGFDRGEIVKVVTPSPHRRPAPCPHYEVCGNCTLQHAEESFYRAWKTERVTDALRRQGLHPKEVRETLFLGPGHRRRATFTARKLRGRLVMGYYRRRSQDVADIPSCPILDPALLGIRNSLKPFLELAVREGNSVDIFLQKSGDAVEAVITGMLGSEERLSAALLNEAAQWLELSDITRLSWRLTEDEPLLLIGEQGHVTAHFGSLEVRLPPLSFLQPTDTGEAALVKLVMDALPEKGRFADLFSGCGTFSGPMLERGPVDAFDSVLPGIRALGLAAKGRPLKSIRRDLFLHPLSGEELKGYDAVVFDPPRAGCSEQAGRLAASSIPRLVGVSCNPATFARDARILVQGGYRLDSVQPVDQFHWSHHVEVVGVFTRRKS